jgi:putative ABC transport system substrate-binding protein
MKTAIGLLLLVAVIMGHPSLADAQQPKKVPRIGYLSPLDAGRESSRAQIIREGLRDLGYIEGQNIAIEYRYAEGKRDRHGLRRSWHTSMWTQLS